MPSFTAMKMKGLPFSVTREDIISFFQGCNLLEDSIKIGFMPDGRLTGEACVIFGTPDDCFNAHKSMDQKHIGSRWVKLIKIVMDEYNNFEIEQGNKYGGGGNDFYGSRRGGGNFSSDRGYGGDRGSRGGRGGRGRGGDRGGPRGGHGGYNNDGGYQQNNGGDRYGGSQNNTNVGGGTVRLSDFVNADNRYSAIKMRGLPFSATTREIRDFFEDFRVAERDITIDMNQGRPTGYALVFFESESEAQRAKDTLNKKYLGSRYVDLSFPDLR